VTPLPGTQSEDAKAYLARTTTSAVNFLIVIDLLTLSGVFPNGLSSNSHNIPLDPVNMALTAQTQTQKAKEVKVVTSSSFSTAVSQGASHLKRSADLQSRSRRLWIRPYLGDTTLAY
jgi:hypothetical protein